jgi:hypothetical protein
MDKPFAVFVLVQVDGGYAATTRTKGRIGLPGGKVEKNESPVDAAYREGKEEGWEIKDIDPNPIQTVIREGKLFWWFKAKSAKKLDTYKEQGKITAFVASGKEILTSGYSNATLPITGG